MPIHAQAQAQCIGISPVHRHELSNRRARRYTHTLGHVMIIAVAVAGAVSIAVEGYHVIFDGFNQDRDDLNEYEILWVVPLVAIPSGLLGGLWAVGLLLGVHVKRLLLAYGCFAPYAISLACGLALAATGFWTGGETWGSGFRQARAVLVPELEGFPDEAGPLAAGVQPSRLFFLLKAVATWLSFWSGIPGGIFAPSIAIGTGFGAFMHDVLIQPAMRGTLIMDTGPHRPVIAAIAACAYFAGVTQAPITSFAVCSGMFTVRGHYFIAMICASFLATATARLVSPRALYSALADHQLAPLPPESLQFGLKRLPPPVYAAPDDPARLAHFIEVEVRQRLSSLYVTPLGAASGLAPSRLSAGASVHAGEAADALKARLPRSRSLSAKSEDPPGVRRVLSTDGVAAVVDGTRRVVAAVVNAKRAHFELASLTAEEAGFPGREDDRESVVAKGGGATWQTARSTGEAPPHLAPHEVRDRLRGCVAGVSDAIARLFPPWLAPAVSSPARAASLGRASGGRGISARRRSSSHGPTSPAAPERQSVLL